MLMRASSYDCKYININIMMKCIYRLIEFYYAELFLLVKLSEVTCKGTIPTM